MVRVNCQNGDGGGSWGGERFRLWLDWLRATDKQRLDVSWQDAAPATMQQWQITTSSRYYLYDCT